MNIRGSKRGQSLEVRWEGSGFRIQDSGAETANCKLKIANYKLQNLFSHEPKASALVGGGQCETACGFDRHSSFILHPSSFRHGFTLVELLVTIAIIAILAGLSLGGLRWTRRLAAEEKTKTTIAKLNDIIMRQYASYMTRRVPVDMSGFPPKIAAIYRLLLLRDVIRMEMPERYHDIEDLPLDFFSSDIDIEHWPWPSGTNITKGTNQWEITFNYQELIIPRIHLQIKPAIFQLYQQIYIAKSGTSKYGPAECLYLIVSMGHPEDMEQFSQDEIGDVDSDGWPEFIDGWGMPIMLLRWVPGFSSGEGLNPNPFNPSNPTQQRVDLSEIQTGNSLRDHDPFDTSNVNLNAFRLMPLIYSAGPDKKYGLEVSENLHFNGDPYQFPTSGERVGTPVAEPDGSTNTHLDNIHNHHIEQK